mgnify:CR=1 FL=1
MRKCQKSANRWPKCEKSQIINNSRRKRLNHYICNSMNNQKRKRLTNSDKYLSMTDKELNDLPEFTDDIPCLYNVGKSLMGKRTLIEHIKLLKQYKNK